MSFDDPFKLTSNSFSPHTRKDHWNTSSSSESFDNFFEFERSSSFDGGETQDSDLSDDQASNHEVVLNSQHPLNHLMFVSMLEHICMLYGKDEETSEALFKVVCEKLKSGMLIPNLSYLDNFKAVRVKYQNALKKLMTNSILILKPKIQRLQSEPYGKLLGGATSSFNVDSWYCDTFSMKEHIASGGFGVVVKARNKLDNKTYAIKKIPLIDTNIKKILQTLREVQIFSNLEHPNIVRYHSSWLEQGLESSHVQAQKSKCKEDSKTQDSDSKFERSQENDEEEGDKLVAIGRHHQQFLSSGGFFGEIFNHQLQQPSPLSSSPPKIVPLSEEEDEVDDHLDKHQQVLSKKEINNRPPTQIKLLRMTLYIQMELCNLTLRKWLQQRNSNYKVVDRISKREVQKIIEQMLSAVEYIHKQGLMHRDLKPDNVFLSYKDDTDVTVKVGDFGLARYRPTKSAPLSPAVAEDENRSFFLFDTINDHTVGVGTTTYAAPEQLKSSLYTNKVDVWSLGIICYELFQPFTTDMERIYSIKDLIHTRKLTERMTSCCKDEAEMILKMTQVEASKRPEVSEVLILFRKDDQQIISELEGTILQQQKYIEELEKQLKENQLCAKCKELSIFAA